MKSTISIKIPTYTAILAPFAALSAMISVAHAQDVDYSDHIAVLAYADLLYHPDENKEGERIYFRQDLGNKQLSHDFVYNDPRRAFFNGGHAGLTYGVKEENVSSDQGLKDQLPWMHDSFTAWTDLQCGAEVLDVLEVDTSNDRPGVVEWFFKYGEIPAIWEADVTQVGFKSAADFSFFANNPNTLGVTFTLFWSYNGYYTDIDDNGKFDAAFREIYYNDEFEWADDGTEGRQHNGPKVFDFPTVAVHEVGHGFSVAHFGSIGVQNGKLVASPRAIMNAIYEGTMHELNGADKGGFCSNWAQWGKENENI